MISVPEIHVMKLRVMILRLSIEIDNWRIKKDDFDLIWIVILIVILNYPLKRIKGGIDGDNLQTLLMT